MGRGNQSRPLFLPISAVTDRKEGTMNIAFFALCTAELVAAIALYRASTKR
ncbi:hypothetical protein [Clavibacter michiganensis]|uniref:hypothetical protein n=1 Tax=Clavibacter michiganensis TaxID=28447 RepID=UPI0026DB6087|nr:hypothetical protein [Clavibacter michiganensis]MDO4039348.1 hypothetical protein [Clavibacter michiganensis]MDO4063985.1 hypothetical protein [Clavibacter michiganensis]MDO4110156.1 hypothetical protein [Clavibacter michiganensis]MDO4113334.1 hypothetical protein [Clavibacter michiganensis]MDO4116670.1 hypothetical protein [Clavibacter michiganensis]